jgi:hypothetical protein
MFTKDPDATLDYTVDWQYWLQSGEKLIASNWDVPSGITKEKDFFDDTSATIWLSGGTVGTTYSLTNQIETNHGRKDDRTIRIRVMER